MKNNNESMTNMLEEKLYSRNFTKWGFDMNPVVSIGAGLIVLLFSLYSLLNLDTALAQFEGMQASIIANFDWLFVGTITLMTVICFYLAFSKIGQVKIGGVDAKPEFSNFSWYAMLSSAGLGIGLMFWAVGEPLFHLAAAPPIFDSSNSAASAIATTYFHWAFHPWALYSLVAVSLAFYAYNKGLPLSFRSLFYPILKEKTFGIIGDIIDILAVVACLFGLATSLGFGVQQVNSGLNYLFNVDINSTVQIGLIVGITTIAAISISSGLDKGVKKLSEVTMKIAFVLVAAIFLVGPTMYIIKLLFNSLGIYIAGFAEASFFVDMDNAGWQGPWTIFYLAWYVSWSPFVGTFIARISKGRSVKEFILAVMIVPSVISMLWITVFGGTALFVDAQAGGELYNVASANLPVALYEMISYLNTPVFAGAVRTLLSLVGTMLILFFFITSSDSGSLVVDNLTSGGKLDSPIPQRVFWASMEGLIAAVLLLVGGDQALSALQAVIISTGLPFSLLLIVMAITIVYSLTVAYNEQKKSTDMVQFEKVERLVKTKNEHRAS